MAPTCWRQKPCDWFPRCPPLFCQFQRDEGRAIVECRSGFNLVHLVGQCVLVEAEHLEGFGKLHRQVDVQPVQPGASQSLHSMLKSSPINRLEGVGKGFAGHLEKLKLLSQDFDSLTLCVGCLSPPTSSPVWCWSLWEREQEARGCW